MSDFLKCLLRASEKAAVIARTIRQEDQLFSLLVEEKGDAEKNKRFYQDFKTLADVLIQQVVIHDIGKQYCDIADFIRGEENNKLTNTLGETVIVDVKETEEETAALLAKVLDGNMRAAGLLASCVHNNVTISFDLDVDEVNVELPLSDMGIWIDPIDSTAEYIYGNNSASHPSGIHEGGLPCVTVLLGSYLRSSGEPVVGVVNQPFYEWNMVSSRWQGRFFWGVSPRYLQKGSLSTNLPRSIQHSTSNSTHANIVMSSSESDHLKTALKGSYELIFAPGAGYKQMCVALGQADAYLLSKGSTFRWDCCAPHALLKAAGGGIVKYKYALLLKDLDLLENKDQIRDFELTYSKAENSLGVDQWCNMDGLIAYRDVKVLKSVVALLKSELKTGL